MGKLVQFLVAIALLVGLASCSASRQSANPKKNYYYTHPFHAHNIIHHDPSLGPDTAVVRKVAAVKDTTKTPPTLAHLSKLQRLFGRKTKPQEVVAEPGHIDLPAGWSPPKKCKGCQITIVTGDNNRVSQATVGKNKAAAAIASDSAQVIDQHEATNAAVAAKGAAITQTNTAPKVTAGATIAAKLAGPPGIVLGVATAGGLLYGLYWLVVIRRKKKQVEALV